MTAKQTINHDSLLVDACLDATKEAPPVDAVFTKLDRWLRFGKGKQFALKVIAVDGGYIYIIQDFITGETSKGCTVSQKEFTPEERREFAKKRKELEVKRQARQQRKERMLAGLSKLFWDRCLPFDRRQEPHAYMVLKREQPKNARFYQSHKRDVIVIPIACPFSGLKSLYIIDNKGFKRPLLGSTITGNMMVISDQSLSDVARIGVAEGYATGITVHHSFDVPVVVAFNCHNLKPVIEKLRAKYPDAAITLFSDNDIATFEKRGINPGVKAAQECKEAFPEIEVIYPEYPSGAKGLSDFNDLKIWFEDNRPSGKGGADE